MTIYTSLHIVQYWCAFMRWVSYPGLSSVVLIEDVEGDLLGDSTQQTG